MLDYENILKAQTKQKIQNSKIQNWCHQSGEIRLCGTCTRKKHLLNLEARTKEKLADGRPIGGIGRLSDAKIKKYYGLAIRQNTIRKSNPARRKVEVAVYAMKKKHYGESQRC